MEKRYDGIVIDVYRKNFDGFEAEILDHPGGVCIAAEKDDGSFFLVKQFRYGIEKELWEFPAGTIDPNEKPETTALRELREEVGYEAKHIEYMGKIYPSPAYLNEVLYLYYASDLNFVGQSLDEDEDLLVETISFDELTQLVESNKIEDAKTIALYYKLKQKRSDS